MLVPSPLQLSTHFKRTDFERPDPMPTGVVLSYAFLCAEILEPIREHFNAPIIINSGYRSSEHNRTIGGVATSQHIATEDHCAADWKIPPLDLRFVYDWIRLISDLPFDQLILELEEWDGPPACIHTSWSKTPRRMALEGLTHGRGQYIHRAVGPFPKHAAPIERAGES